MLRGPISSEVDEQRISDWVYFLRTGRSLSITGKQSRIIDRKLEGAIQSAQSIITKSEEVVHRISQKEFSGEYFSEHGLFPKESAYDALINLSEIASDPVTLQTLVTLEGYRVGNRKILDLIGKVYESLDFSFGCENHEVSKIVPCLKQRVQEMSGVYQ